MNEQPPPTEQQAFSEAFVSELKQQRNQAMDIAAEMSGRIAVLERQVADLRKQIKEP